MASIYFSHVKYQEWEADQFKEKLDIISHNSHILGLISRNRKYLEME